MLALLQAAAGPGAGDTAALHWAPWVILLPFLGFLANGALAFWAPTARRAVSCIGAGVLIAAFALSLAITGAVHSTGLVVPVVTTVWQWLPVGTLQVAFATQIDQLSAVMLLIITGVGSLIHLYSIGYMHDDAGYARYFSYLNLFVAFMLVLVLGASMPVMFIGWEGVGLCSYLLIGFWFTDKANADAGKKAFLANRVGDVGFLIAMFITWHALGTLDFTGIAELAPSRFIMGGAVVTAITLCLILGCTGKSAQIPLYTWLPDAMAGPTPVSALIHAATMVTAGVYLVARTNILFALAPFSSAVLAGIGAVTALFAASIGLRQNDIKKVLAYSTISQLGYMFLAVGTGAYVAGIFHLATHAFFKALLFLGAGSVIHAMHHAYHATHNHADAQDMRNMGGLAKHLPWTATLMGIATLAIAGVPPFAGFFSKDEILSAAFARGAEEPIFYAFWLLGLLAALCTAVYMARLMAMTFFGENRTGTKEQAHLHEAPWSMTGPLLVLGLLSILGGALNLPEIVGGTQALARWLAPVVGPAARYRAVEPVHGSTEYLLLSSAIVIAVIGLALGWRMARGSRIVVPEESEPERGIAKLLYDKYYVDELYDAIIISPLIWFSERILWKDLDQNVIDGAVVNGSWKASRAFGWLGSQLQTGQVGVYIVLFLAGALYVLHAVAR
ncbi:MAG: NADH-quinone oxidoreductase subunit L [Gemmatimonadales bacterium]